MDKVVQQNAAGSEETSSASSEMRAQADQMKAMIGDLVVMVSGGNKQLLLGEPIQEKSTKENRFKWIN